MPIIFHSTTKIFHLYNQEISYLIIILKNNQLGQLYYGKRITDHDDFSHLLEQLPRPMSVLTFEKEYAFSLEHIKQEYPTYGTGDMRLPALDILQKNGSRITDFQYKNHRISKGKPSLSKLPSTYVETIKEATTIEITMHDSLINTDLILSYTIYNDMPVICRSARYVHFGKEEIMLDRAMSMSLDLPDKEYHMLTLTGSWARERAVEQRTLAPGVQSIASLRGCSSSQCNPFIALKRDNTDEFNGEVIGFSLVYSGNFLAQVEVDTYDVTRIMLGIHPHCFSWILKQGESFQTPEVVMVYSLQGINGMSQSYHQLYRERLIRGKYRDTMRPIVINNWEGTYYQFNERRILDMARAAKKLGIELFILDDGWFKNRNNDTSGLGDWQVDVNKIPSGLGELSRKITSMDMLFGIWLEPEMVTKDTCLYKEHPTWVLATPSRSMSHGRNQYILDFSNPAVVDYMYMKIETILKGTKISYLKWDMNRCMSEVYSMHKEAKEQGRVMHQYILGVYSLYERLIQKFPTILFESSASGGARFDPGMLYYAPLCWTSDNTDAISRLKIQYGTTYVYPLISIATHVSTIPNHQVLRNTPLDTRANVAYFGTFGYELDPTKVSKQEQEIIISQIQFVKKYRRVIQFGTFYRLRSPFTMDTSAWMVVSKDKNIALVGYYRPLQVVNSSYQRILLQGLEPLKKYHVSILDIDCYGDELMNVGLLVSDNSSGRIKEKYNGNNGDYQSRIYCIEKKE